MNCKAIFLDIDGTLVSFQNHQIPRSTREALHAVRRKGVKVYIATGRPLLFIDNLDGLEYDGMVTTTGAHCLDAAGHTLSQTAIHKEDIMRLVTHHELSPEEAFPVVFVTAEELFLSRTAPELQPVADLLHIEMPPVCPVSYALDKDILQLIAFFPQQEDARYRDTLLPHCKVMRWHPAFADIVSSDTGKSAGIDFMLAHEGLSLSDAVAIGDGGNDIEMLRHAGYGIAMGNASDEVKQAADWVTASVDEDGIWHAMQHLGLL